MGWRRWLDLPLSIRPEGWRPAGAPPAPSPTPRKCLIDGEALKALEGSSTLRAPRREGLLGVRSLLDAAVLADLGV